MGRGHEPDPAVGGPDQGLHVVGYGDLVHRDPFRRHGPDQLFDPDGLRTARKHVRASSYRKLRDPLPAGRQLSPFIHQTHPAAEAIGDLPDQIPEDRGLSGPWGTQDQDRSRMRPEKTRSRVGAAEPFPGQTQTKGLGTADRFYHAVFRGNGTADPETAAADQGHKAPADLFLDRVGGAS